MDHAPDAGNPIGKLKHQGFVGGELSRTSHPQEPHYRRGALALAVFGLMLVLLLVSLGALM